MSDTILIHEEWACARCTLFNPASSVFCVVYGATHPLPEQRISPAERHVRDRPRKQLSGAWAQAMGVLGAAAGSAAGAILSSTRRGARRGAHALWMAFGAAAGIEGTQASGCARRLSRPQRGLRRLRWQTPAFFREYLTYEREEVPWMQRQSSQAARLLTAAQQGNAPERRVEQLHLLQLYLRLHRQAYERAGDPTRGREAMVMAAHSLALLYHMSNDELYEYYQEFGGLSMAQGVPAEVLNSLPSTTLCVLEGLPSIGGRQVTSCSICLEDFASGERVKELPKCQHIFHAHCVDTWLCMHNACPLCRVPAV